MDSTQAAAWLQQRLKRDETAFRRRPGAAAALTRLRTASEAIAYRVHGDAVDLLLGRRLGGFALAEPHDAAAVAAFADRFYGDYAALFGRARAALRVERVRTAGSTVAEIQQYVDGIPVADARWTLIFDRAGHLTHVTGRPYDVTVSRQPSVDAARARTLAVAELEPLEDLDVSTSLALEGRTNRLVWSVEVKSRRRPSLFGEFAVDAHRGTVTAREDRCEHGVVAIPVRRYSHPSGVMDSSGSLGTSDVNVDTLEADGADVFALQRLGSGRSRVWNAKPVGADSTPLFSRAISFREDYFTKDPDATDDHVFNEQQTYYWAQTLKTHVDEWGREPNAYGHYPVDAARALNVEIVVNGDAAMEGPWSPSGTTNCMHGYFRSEAPRSWFLNHPATAAVVPAVFLFNSAGNSASPQFFGPEYSSSYSIVAHEVGHFISWQYGGWSGAAGTLLGSSLNEGHSMVLAALLGTQHFGLSYEDSEYVTTGSMISGAQWSHFVYGTPPLKYDAMDCVNDNQYYIAWPFVQAMWRLMHNKDVDGNRIWATADAALANTADLFMYGLSCFSADSTMTWDKLCIALLARIYERIGDGTEQDPLPDYDSYCGVFGVFNDHGLLAECVNSP